MMKRALLSVSLALALCGAAAGHEHEHAGGTAHYREHALELLRARQAEKAAAFLQYALDHYPLDVPLNLLYLDVLREEGLEMIGESWYEAYGEDDDVIILYALGWLAAGNIGNDARDYYERALKADKTFTPARVGLADVSFRRGDLEFARAELDRALDQDEDEWRAYVLRGEMHLVTDELEDAERDLKRAIELSDYAPTAHGLLGETLLRAGDAAGARDEYREAIAWSDDRGAYYLGLAKAQEELGELDAARLAYNAAFERAYGNMTVAVAARKGAGRLAFGAGDMAEAADDITWALTFTPDDAELRAYLGGLYAHVGRPAEAAAAFKRAAELEPENVEYENLYKMAVSNIGELKNAEGARYEVLELLMAGRREDALAVLELALEKYPLDDRMNLLYLDIVEEDGLMDEAREVYKERSTRWGEEPIILIALGRLTADIDMEEAESKYNRALEVGGPSSAAYVGLAELGLRRGRAGHAEAEEYVVLSLATDSEYKRPYRVRGSIRLLNNAPGEAASDFKLALEGEPYDPVARELLAQTYGQLGNYEAALEEYQKTIYYNSNNSRYYWGLAGVLNRLGRAEDARQAYEAAAFYTKGEKRKVRALEKAADVALTERNSAEAAKYLAEAVEISPHDRSLRLRLGRALAEQGKYDEAINAIEAVLDSNPDDGHAWYELGSVLKAKGDLVRAEAALANAVRLLPVNIEMRYPRSDAERMLAEVREALGEPEEGETEE